MISDLRHIRAFLALARAGSFTRASAELHMAQPTLTVQIQQLEAALGIKLFDRNKRHVALTQAGRDLLLPLERILLDVDAIAASTQELLHHRRGLVTVAALPSMAASLLPRAIKRLSPLYPGITVRVHDGVAAEVAAMAKSGKVDFGVSSQTMGIGSSRVRCCFSIACARWSPAHTRSPQGRALRFGSLPGTHSC